MKSLGMLVAAEINTVGADLKGNAETHQNEC